MLRTELSAFETSIGQASAAWAAERLALRNLADTLAEQLNAARTHPSPTGRDRASVSVHQAYAATGLRGGRTRGLGSSPSEETAAELARLRARVVDLQRQAAAVTAAGGAAVASAAQGIHTRILWVEAHAMEAALAEARQQARQQVAPPPNLAQSPLRLLTPHFPPARQPPLTWSAA